jgi:hypothetical protein
LLKKKKQKESSNKATISERLGHCSPHCFTRLSLRASAVTDWATATALRQVFAGAILSLGSDDWASAAALRHLFADDDHPPGMPAPSLPLPSYAKRAPQTLSCLNPDLTLELRVFTKKSSGAHILGLLLVCIHAAAVSCQGNFRPRTVGLL